MNDNISMFGFQGNAAECAAYDMMVMNSMGLLNGVFDSDAKDGEEDWREGWHDNGESSLGKSPGSNPGGQDHFG